MDSGAQWHHDSGVSEPRMDEKEMKTLKQLLLESAPADTGYADMITEKGILKAAELFLKQFERCDVDESLAQPGEVVEAETINNLIKQMLWHLSTQEPEYEPELDVAEREAREESEGWRD